MRGNRVLLSTCAAAVATALSTAAARHQAPPADRLSLSPRLVAIVVPNLERAKAWYTGTLDFEELEQKDFPDRGLRICFLRSGAFELELVESKTALPRTASRDDIGVEGLAKVAFNVSDVRSLFERLHRAGVIVVVPPTQSGRTQRLHMIVKDDSGNLLQFFE